MRLALDSVVEEVLGDASGVTGARVKSLKNGETAALEARTCELPELPVDAVARLRQQAFEPLSRPGDGTIVLIERQLEPAETSSLTRTIAQSLSTVSH